MYGLGFTLLILGGLLFTLFSRTLFLGDGTGQGIYPVRLDDLFYWAQWTAFWITAAALLAFGLSRSEAAGWKRAAPAIAIVLCLHFVAFSMPLLENRNAWAAGTLGGKVYFAAKQNARHRRAAAAANYALFTGDWITADGAFLRVDPGQTRLTASGSVFELGMGNPESFAREPRARIEYELARSGRNELRTHLRDELYPVFTVHQHSGAESTLILLDRDHLLLLPHSGDPRHLTRKGVTP